jgi:broad specificity phosphatase PhoE
METLHLVRHGEVDNPDGVVYAMLPGFGLSAAGNAQAMAAASHLARSAARLVISSPLQRAVETATPIADRLGVVLRLDDRVTEWHLARRWAGVRWTDLAEQFPGELEAYLAAPADLPFDVESIAQVADRMAEVVAALDTPANGPIVVVSHQDPIQSLRLRLTGRDLAELGRDKPGHGTVITLSRNGDGWSETETWSPPGPFTPFPPGASGADT